MEKAVDDEQDYTSRKIRLTHMKVHDRDVNVVEKLGVVLHRVTT